MFVRSDSLAQVYLAGFAAEHLLTRRRPRQYDVAAVDRLAKALLTNEELD